MAQFQRWCPNYAVINYPLMLQYLTLHNSSNCLCRSYKLLKKYVALAKAEPGLLKLQTCLFFLGKTSSWCFSKSVVRRPVFPQQTPICLSPSLLPLFVSKRCQLTSSPSPPPPGGVSLIPAFSLINDFLHGCVITVLYFYADGTTVHFNGKSVSRRTTELQKDFDRLDPRKQTGFKCSKTKTMPFGFPKHLSSNCNLPLMPQGYQRLKNLKFENQESFVMFSDKTKTYASTYFLNSFFCSVSHPPLESSVSLKITV